MLSAIGKLSSEYYLTNNIQSSSVHIGLSEINIEDTIELSSEAISKAASSSKEDSSKVSGSSLAEKLKEITVCNNCGAIFMGASTLTVCPKCQNDISSNENDKNLKNQNSNENSSQENLNVIDEDLTGKLSTSLNLIPAAD